MDAQKFKAEQVINDIRRHRGIIEGDFAEELKANPSISSVVEELKKDLKSTVEVLARQLNSKNPHFIFEFVQNADDNQYALGVEPSLTFTLTHRRLRIDCNEVGFNEENVRAICRAGRSTKTGTGYIGEKGIGFKSVFKVANVVRVSSGPYAFAFYRSKELGMITPVLEPFPQDQIRTGYTQFLLELESDGKQHEISKALSDLQISTPMFLKKLKCLAIDFESGSRKTISCQNAKDGKVILTAKEEHPSGVVSEDSTTYVVVKSLLGNLPYQPEREGITKSEVILAFPLDHNDSPMEKSQETHAFLPIKDYGFRFLIQGDFLLTASREDMLDCEWNDRLQKGIARTFLDAVIALHSIPSLRYTWMRYIAYNLPNSLLSPLETRITTLIQESPTLLSWTESLQQPKNLRYLGREYCDSTGAPIVGEMASYLSPNYNWERDGVSLRRVGVRAVSPSDFVKELFSVAQRSFGAWTDHHSSWHENVAETLLQIPWGSLQPLIAKLPLIPLRDQSWISYDKGQFNVFLDEEDNLKVPGGLDIQLVNSIAMASTARVKLFEKLGLKHCNANQIWKNITQLHKSSPSGIANKRHAMEYLVYLFRIHASSSTVPHEQMWLVDSEGVPARAHSLCMALPGDSIHGVVVTEDPSCIRYIHPEYITIVGEQNQAAWKDWLVHKIGVADRPRLVEHGEVSPAFLSITVRYESSVWLNFLKCGGFYVEQVVSPTIYDTIASMPVTCLDGTIESLKETILPNQNLLLASKSLRVESMPFLKVDKPEDPRWATCLNQFFVVTRLDIAFYSKILRYFNHQGIDDKNRVEEIYKAVNCLANPFTARTEFHLHPLIYLPWSEGPRWVTSSACVWRAPPGYREKVILMDQWLEHEEFFRSVLSIKNVDLDMVIADLRKYLKPQQQNERGYMKDLLLMLPRFTKSTLYGDKIKGLSDLPIFPIRNAGSRIIQNSKGRYFIADREDLQKCFDGRIPQLDLSIPDIHKLQQGQIFSLLKMDYRYLSKVVHEESRPLGRDEVNKALTSTLVQRASALLRCGEFYKPDRKPSPLTVKMFKQMLNPVVYTAAKIRIRRTIRKLDRVMDKDVVVEIDGDICLQTSPDSTELTIFVNGRLPHDHPILAVKLPREIAKFLGTNKDNMFRVVIGSGAKYIDDVLRVEGIPELTAAPWYDDFLVDLEKTEPAIFHRHFEIKSGCPIPLGVCRIVTDDDELAEKLSSVTVSKTGQTSGASSNVTSGFDEVDEAVQDLPPSGHQYSRKPTGRPPGTASASQPRSATADAPEVSSDQMLRNIKAASESFRKMQESVKSGEFATKPVANLSSPSEGPTAEAFRRVAPTLEELNVGILGEQYAFEILKKAAPGFNDSHWTSTLKKYATNLPEYRKLKLYSGYETSDFVFKDADGHLTKYLADSGHKQARRWLSDPPTYLIEVKATASNRSTPFSLSNYQTELAQNLKQATHPLPKIPTTVYAIFRVFDMNKKPGHFIYLDPGRMVEEGSLRSTPVDGTTMWPAAGVY